MQTDRIEIPIDAEGNAEQGIARVNAQLGTLSKTTKMIQQQQLSLGQQMQNSWTEINNGIQSVMRVYNAVNRVVQDVIKTNIDYANQVRTITQVTGQSAEAVSRIIQLTDDYKIEGTALNVVMKKMASEGMPLSTESLARLSDQYLKLAPGVERQIFLTEKFGRQGTTFAEIMLQGGDAIRKQSAAISENLLMTQKALDATREYEIQTDTLNETFMALKITIGNELIPTANVYLDALNKMIAGEMNLFQAGGYFWNQIRENGRVFPEFSDFAGKAADDINILITAMTNLSLVTQDYSSFASGAATSLEEVGVAAIYAQLSLDGTFTADDAQKVLDFRYQLGLLTEDEYKSATAALDLQRAIDALRSKNITITTDFISNYITNVQNSNPLTSDNPRSLPGSGLTAEAGSTVAGYVVGQTYRMGGIIYQFNGSNMVPVGKYANGGVVGSGSWAMVGDALGGGRTPYTEYVYFAPGGGGVVYNQAQMAGKSAPPMAGGGVIMPPGGDIADELRALRRDLPRAMREALQMVIQ